MNKKLIALAVAGACVAPTVMAQTANPVTLYGRVYLTVENVEADGSAGYDDRTRMQDQASLLGVRGTEDLGGGLKAFFQLETAFAPDQTGGSFANRNSGIGLQGGFGSFLIGRWDMPWKSATIAIDPFGAYEKHEDPNATYTEEEGFAGGGAFTFGPVKIGGQYQQIEKSARTGGSPDDQKSWMANIVYTLGKNQFIGQYMTSENHNNINDAECDTYHLGYQYNFTRRTFFLAQYSEIDNNETGRCNFGSGRINASGAGEFDPSGFSLGLRHVF